MKYFGVVVFGLFLALAVLGVLYLIQGMNSNNPGVRVVSMGSAGLFSILIWPVLILFLLFLIRCLRR